jgi:hypothetical protein
MLTVALVFIFFAILAVAYELHVITDRLIGIGTIVEHYNRRDLRASGILKDLDDSGDSEPDEHVPFNGESATARTQKLAANTAWYFIGFRRYSGANRALWFTCASVSPH